MKTDYISLVKSYFSGQMNQYESLIFLRELKNNKQLKAAFEQYAEEDESFRNMIEFEFDAEIEAVLVKYAPDPLVRKDETLKN